MSRHYPTRSLARLVLLSGLAASSVQADVVTDWNSVALDAVIAAREAQPTQARSVTMVHVAMFEAKYVALIGGAVLFGIASAHDFYDEKCCHEQDCRPVKCHEIMSFGANKGWSCCKVFFPADRLHLSPDGNCHVCVGQPGLEPAGICIYLPPGI